MKVTPETIGVFKQMKEQIKAFEMFTGKVITFESFDYDFYERFVDFYLLNMSSAAEGELRV